MNEIRKFESGATRNSDKNKIDYEGFVNPFALEAYGEYMHTHRLQADGTLRDSDNWQKGIPLAQLVKSLIRHTVELWKIQRGGRVFDRDTGKEVFAKDICCAIWFNAQACLLHFIKESDHEKAKESQETE